MKSKLIILSVFGAILAMSALFASADARADGWRHHGGHYVYRPGYGWVFPTVIGGVIGYEIARSAPPAPQTVIIQQPAPVMPPPGVVPPAPPYGFHWEAILDANCNCYRSVMVPN